jgi:TonB family protein
MRARPKQRSLGAIAAIFLAAILVNFLGCWFAQEVIDARWEGELPSPDGMMEVALVPDEEEVEEPAEEEDPSGNLVQNHAVPKDERPPENTDRVSEFDSRVDEETRAPTRPDGAPQPPTKPGDTPQADRGKQLTKFPSPAESQSESKAERDAKGEEGEGSEVADDNIREDEEGSIGSMMGEGGGQKAPGIAGSPDMLRRTFGGPGSIDQLKDVDEGEANILNSRRSRFASFFNRVRDQVAQHWHPDIVHAQRDPEGKVHGNKTRITKLLIRLNRDGTVKRIVVDKPSGVGYLDEEAIRAVRTAQPFTNPPPQLIDTNSGFIDFGFRFIFELDGSRRIFRYSR